MPLPAPTVVRPHEPRQRIGHSRTTTWLPLLALLVLAALLAAPPAAAQAVPRGAAAWVSSVQMPAWLERAGVREPLAPGMVLRTGDVVLTGALGRAQVRLAEGSLLRLGESGRLALNDLRVVRGRSTLLAGVFQVAQGAFRFTTAAIGRTRSERDLRIRIATVTAGVRGTDLWGRGTAEREIVCLIEGLITVTRDADAPITMSQPLSFYVAPVGAPAGPVAPVDPQQLALWARETDPVAGAGAAILGGRWRVTVLVTSDSEAALQAWDALRTGGYAARILPVRTGTGHDYDVRIGGLASQAEARGLAKRLSGQPGVTGEPVAGRQ